MIIEAFRRILLGCIGEILGLYATLSYPRTGGPSCMYIDLYDGTYVIREGGDPELPGRQLRQIASKCVKRMRQMMRQIATKYVKMC